jgi:hypothetical protein
MKTLATTTLLWVALGLSLPSYGDILVYKLTQNGTDYEFRNFEWQVVKGKFQGYVVLDLNYDEFRITQAGQFTYWSRGGEKLYEEDLTHFSLVRVQEGDKTRWVVMRKERRFEGFGMHGEFTMVEGDARARKIDVNKREVAGTLSGRFLSGTHGVDLLIFKTSLTLYSAWTGWANGDKEQGVKRTFDDTMEMIRNSLLARGYTVNGG